jgi:hypothetical protein
MDLVDFSQKLYKLLKEREDDIIITLTTGAVQNHEQYKQLVGELQGLSYTRDQKRRRGNRRPQTKRKIASTNWLASSCHAL